MFTAIIPGQPVDNYYLSPAALRRHNYSRLSPAVLRRCIVVYLLPLLLVAVEVILILVVMVGMAHDT